MEVLTGDGGVAERRRIRDNERRWLELSAREKEGAKELRREGMRCGESWGSHRPFIGAGGSNGGVNGVNAIEGWGEVKRGIKEGGSDGRVVKARAASEVELGGTGSDGRWWRRDQARTGRR
jgi:hypothetical protein